MQRPGLGPWSKQAAASLPALQAAPLGRPLLIFRGKSCVADALGFAPSLLLPFTLRRREGLLEFLEGLVPGRNLTEFRSAGELHLSLS